MTLPPRHPHRVPWRHPEANRRVRVTAPRPARVTHRRTGIFAEVDEATLMGEAYVDGLVRSHVHLSVMGLAMGLAMLGVVFFLSDVSEPLWMSRVGGVAPAWICWGPMVFVVVWLVVRVVVSHAEQLDSDCQTSLDPARSSLHQDW